MLVTLLTDYTFLVVITGTALVGATTGVLGVYALLRQQSLVGDAIAHASLPGLVTMFLITQSKVPAVLMIGGACAGIIGVAFMHLLLHTTKLKKDAILGIVLSVFFGVGLVLLTITQKYPVSNQSMLNKFLFGSASTLLASDVYIMAIVASIVLCAVVLLWKECVLVMFDRTYARTAGYAVHWVELSMSCLLVVAIVIGLQAVGVVLMSTMLIAPAAAARQWTTHVWSMALLAGVFGAVAGSGGVCISSVVRHVPTGPMVVVVASMLVMVSLLCAPQRGFIARSRRRATQQTKV